MENTLSKEFCHNTKLKSLKDVSLTFSSLHIFHTYVVRTDVQLIFIIIYNIQMHTILYTISAFPNKTSFNTLHIPSQTTSRVYVRVENVSNRCGHVSRTTSGNRLSFRFDVY